MVQVQVRSIAAFLRYNAGQVFAGKFIYFLLLAVAAFLAVIAIYTAQSQAPPDAGAVYYFLLVPGVLLVFYPAAYQIQNEADARMLETLFGIPDYRFKVWLVRQIVQLGVVGLLLYGLALLSQQALADFPPGAMVLHLMFPLAFLASMGFLLAALLRNGNAAAVLLIVLVLVCWIAVQPLESSRWNLFYNPFRRATALDELVHAETLFLNRVYLLAASALGLLVGLLRLQQRERYI